MFSQMCRTRYFLWPPESERPTTGPRTEETLQAYVEKERKLDDLRGFLYKMFLR